MFIFSVIKLPMTLHGLWCGEGDDRDQCFHSIGEKGRFRSYLDVSESRRRQQPNKETITYPYFSIIAYFSW